MQQSLISESLGMEPDWGWTVGEPRKTPSGDALEGVRRNTYWLKRYEANDGESIADVVSRVLDDLEKSRDFLTNFTETGGRAEFFIGCFQPPGDTFRWVLLKQLAEMRINLSIDL